MIPVIYDLETTELTAEERAFFKDVQPYGYILFERNIENPKQLLALTDSLKELAGNAQLPILIDQEGGRVARMRPPHWPEFPSAKALIAQGNGEAEYTSRLIYQNALKLGETLRQSGITVNCAPVADIPVEGSDPIIGDRAYGSEPESVIPYARAMADGLMDAGVLPVLKHIPGHGRATVDSHLSLPMVDTPLDILEETDFAPFKALNDLPYAMTAHIVYSALDKGQCATFSREIIQYIRQELGFKGLLMSDALNMQALSGSHTQRAKNAFAAGCDLVLHCNGNMNVTIKEMQLVAEVAPSGSERLVNFTQTAFNQLPVSIQATA